MSENSIDFIIKKASLELSNFVEHPKLEIRAFLSFLLKKDKSFLISNSDYLLNKIQIEKVLDFVDRRKLSEPFPYITGEQDFFGLNFKVNKSVLIPRPETEILVECAIKKILEKCKKNSQEKLNILELGVGTGCISIVVANYFRDLDIKINIIGIEKSKEAFKIAIENINYHNLNSQIEFKNLDWTEFFKKNNKKFDLVLSNPPYIETNYNHDSIKHEPNLALFSGKDGLDDIRFLLTELPNHLLSNSVLLFEIGCKQVNGINDFLESSKSLLKIKKVHKDLANLDRVVELII